MPREQGRGCAWQATPERQLGSRGREWTDSSRHSKSPPTKSPKQAFIREDQSGRNDLQGLTGDVPGWEGGPGWGTWLTTKSWKFLGKDLNWYTLGEAERPWGPLGPQLLRHKGDIILSNESRPR